jgi:hypothetical protein
MNYKYQVVLLLFILVIATASVSCSVGIPSATDSDDVWNEFFERPFATATVQENANTLQVNEETTTSITSADSDATQELANWFKFYGKLLNHAIDNLDKDEKQSIGDVNKFRGIMVEMIKNTISAAIQDDTDTFVQMAIGLTKSVKTEKVTKKQEEKVEEKVDDEEEVDEKEEKEEDTEEEEEEEEEEVKPKK